MEEEKQPDTDAAVATGRKPVGAIFISYASQDAEAATSICDALRCAGIEVWFDQADLRGGDAWDQSIRKQIKSCALFLAVISRITHERAEGYFRLEWKLAVDRSHLMASDRAFLLPVVIDETRDDDARVPERFREMQWTRLPGGVVPATFVEHVRRLLSEEPSKGVLRSASEVARANAAPIQRPVRASRLTKAAIIFSVAMAIAALAYFAVHRHVPPTPVTQSEAPAEQAAQAHTPTAFNPPPHSIAVLPFVNMSGDAKQEYFSDGISEELLNSLSRLNDFEVVARTSSFAFKGQNVDVETIAHKLNVRAVLEGSVRRAGNTVRITVQLINAVSGFHMWSQTYDRNLTDILKIQTEVATSVAQQLEGKLVGDETTKFALGGTKNSEAYDAYLRAVKLQSEGSMQEADARIALAQADSAIALDPSYAAAHALRCEILLYIANATTHPDRLRGLREQALSAAQRAVALAPDFGEAHLALADARALGLFDFAAAASEYDRALALAPGSASIQMGYAKFAAMLGHTEAALAATRRAVSIDPQNPIAHIYLSSALSGERRYTEALSALQAVKALTPDSHAMGAVLAYTLLAMSQWERARQTCESHLTPMDDENRHNCLALAYHFLGRQADAQRELDAFKAISGDAGAYIYAGIYAQWGDTPAALEWLRKAEHLADPNLIEIKTDWDLDPIRNEPQFKTIEARMNFPP